MPNHVINEIKFKDLRPEMVQSILDKCVGEDGKVDFEILVPLPITSWPGNVGMTHKETFPSTHLDDARNLWGTKWGPYGQNDDCVVQSKDAVTFTFQTAWSPPYGWLMALFNTFKTSFEHAWLSEGQERGKAAIYDYAALDDFGREAWVEKDADEQTHRHLHKLLWGVEEFTDDDQ